MTRPAINHDPNVVAPTHEVLAARRRMLRRLAQLLPIAVLYIGGLVLPYLYLLRMSFNKYDPLLIFKNALLLDNYIRLFTGAFYLRIAAQTMVLGLTVTLFTLVLGYPVAWKISRSGPRLKSLLLAIVLSPLLVNLVVRTYGWLVILGDKGVVNNFLIDTGLIASPLPLSDNYWSVVIGLGHVTLPFMVLSLLSVMDGLPKETIEAAESLGATKWYTFREVVWPLTWVGVGAGSLLVFSFSISAFVTPSLLGGGRISTISTLIYEQFTFSIDWPLGSALVFLLLAMNLIVITVHARMFRQEI